MILRAELPPGQRLAEAPLAELLGMSRTPVRQALPLLAQEGLLMEHASRGFVVRAFTASDIIDAIDMRGIMEGYAAGRLAEQGVSKSFLRSIKECLDEGDAIFKKRSVDESDEARYAEMNGRFHSLIVEAADSPLLSAALERNNRIPFASAQAVAFGRADLDKVYDIMSYAHRQHHGVVEAIEAGQSTRAESLMREHANSTKKSINLEGFHVMAARPALRSASPA